MISAKKLCKKFGDFEAVKNVSFEIEKGEIVGFLGSNGAGKTTTMRMLTSYFPPTSGTASVAGYDVFSQSLEVRKNVGYLPENVPLYTDMPVEYFIGFAASLKGLSGQEKEEKIKSAIERCGLLDVKDERIEHLSKGYRQRVGIAQAIITNPPVLILDEPTVGLDPKQIIEIRNLIKSFRGKSTVILSTHILHEIEKVCDRILIINAGEILAFDTLDKLGENLTKSHVLSLMIQGEHEKIKDTLKSIPSISKLNDLGKIDDKTFSYQVTIPKNNDIRAKISKILAEKEFSLVEMSLEKMSAEDIFRVMVPENKGNIQTEEVSLGSVKKKKESREESDKR